MIGHSVLTRFVNCKFKSKIGKKLSNYTLGVIELPLLTLRSLYSYLLLIQRSISTSLPSLDLQKGAWREQMRWGNVSLITYSDIMNFPIVSDT